MISVHDAMLTTVAGFRTHVHHQVFGHYRDSLTELTDAILCGPERITSLPALSLQPQFRRSHGAIYAALNNGTIDHTALRQLLLGTLPSPAPTPEIEPGTGPEPTPQPEPDTTPEPAVTWFGADVTIAARPAADTSPGRMLCYDRRFQTRTGHPVTPGWAIATLASLHAGADSWTGITDIDILSPDRNLTTVTLAMLDRIRAHWDTTARTDTPGLVCDADYDAMTLSHHHRDRIHILARLRSNQTFYAQPPPRPAGQRGRQALHGRKRSLNAPETLGRAHRRDTLHHPSYGTVTLRAWDHQHRKITRAKDSYWAAHPKTEALPLIEGTIIQVQATRVPGRKGTPKPMWLWHTGPEPLTLTRCFRIYQRRFDLEHTFRFCKQDLGLVVPATATPQAMARWVWLVVIAHTQLRLVRDVVADLPRPWERPVKRTGRTLSPRRVRRAFREVHAILGTPAQPRRNHRPGPGRPPGTTRPPRTRHPTHRKSDPKP